MNCHSSFVSYEHSLKKKSNMKYFFTLEYYNYIIFFHSTTCDKALALKCVQQNQSFIMRLSPVGSKVVKQDYYDAFRSILSYLPIQVLKVRSSF